MATPQQPNGTDNTNSGQQPGYQAGPNAPWRGGYAPPTHPQQQGYYAPPPNPYPPVHQPGPTSRGFGGYAPPSMPQYQQQGPVLPQGYQGYRPPTARRGVPKWALIGIGSVVAVTVVIAITINIVNVTNNNLIVPPSLPNIRGYYTGSFTNDQKGVASTIAILINEDGRGNLTGCVIDATRTEFAYTGTVTTAGQINLSVPISSSAGNDDFNGSVQQGGDLSGAWTNSATGAHGRWDVRRQADAGAC